MELKKSTVTLREYFYTTLNGNEIEFKALSYKMLDDLQTKYSNKLNQLRNITVKEALVHIEDFYSLTYNDVGNLQALIIEVSTLSPKEINIIKQSISIILEDSFKDDTFKDCKLCQERGLDKQRNCPMLPEDTMDKAVFYLVANQKLDRCPMYNINGNDTVADSLRCYSFYDKGYLPESGGIMDQSMFFVEVSELVKSLIDKHQAKELKKK